ncbi:manganese efflux pump [Paenibacillus sp. P26]|nr:manganese efflux pump [Paenibacillus sp. P26]
MHLLSVFAIGIASNIDNLGIGMSYGMRSTRVPFFSNLLIALLSVIATFLSMTAGDLVSHTLQSPVANAAGGVMIIVLGLWSIRPGAFRRPAEQAAPAAPRVPFFPCSITRRRLIEIRIISSPGGNRYL